MQRILRLRNAVRHSGLLHRRSVHSEPTRPTVSLHALFQTTFTAYQAADASRTVPEHLPLFVTDTGVVGRQYERWALNLPRVRAHYAVKCNPCSAIMQTLKDHGAGFDCASRMEITAALATGVQPDRIIFANPVKPMADIVFARSVGVKAMTCDNICEIEKIHAVFPGAELILRLLADDSTSLMRFGSKYGASPAQTGLILDRIQELGMTLIGVSFHIGSGCRNPQLFESAIELCRTTADQAIAKGLSRFTLVDIGGGFPGDATPFKDSEVPAFEKFAAVIAGALDCHFPEAEFPGIRFISEPGRYFATASGCLFAMVQGKRQETGADGETTYKYYLNDGVYGSFNSIMYDYQKPVARTMEEAFAPPLVEVEVEHSSHSFLGPPSHTRIGLEAGMHAFSTKRRVSTFRSTIFGPTCDSLDTLVEDVHIRELQYGEWLCFDNMGAYTTAAASTFNGVPLPHKAFIHSPKDLQAA